MKDLGALPALLTIWTTTLLAMFWNVFEHVEKGVDSTGGSFHDLLQKNASRGLHGS